mmetsp:Transcript_85388/g.141419  ORF Transcript_85388/g.141419 Transcript_85388/m.141419 type:complete len:83 (-) Transcript_85388:1820-2068(-)
MVLAKMLTCNGLQWQGVHCVFEDSGLRPDHFARPLPVVFPLEAVPKDFCAGRSWQNWCCNASPGMMRLSGSKKSMSSNKSAN